MVGCMTDYNVVPSGYSLSLTFEYDEDTGEAKSANIGVSPDKGATFISPNPNQTPAYSPLPGMGPIAQVFSVHINSGALTKLSNSQLKALDKATAGGKDPVNRAINQAVVKEEQNRAKENARQQQADQQKCNKSDKDRKGCGS